MRQHDDSRRGVNDPAAEPAGRGVSRRSLLAVGTATAAALLASGTPAALAAPRTGAATRTGTGSAVRALSTFTAVPAGISDTVTVPAGFQAVPLARWGDGLSPASPRWLPAGGSAAAQATQVGSHHHGVEFLPRAAGQKGLLVITHESADETVGQVPGEVAMAAQGVTVVAVAAESDGVWRTAGSRFNRRLTADTPVTPAGPAAERITGAGGPAVRGVLAPSATGTTPWGTVLLAEKNANAFFGTDSPTWRRGESERRYGLAAGGLGSPWHAADARFDLAACRALPEAFGWIVELDPDALDAGPVKRTALGRFWHGAAAVTETSDGRVVVYSTDAEDGEYLYRFVSSGPWRTLRTQGRSPLDHGTLAVARLSGDGSGRWLPLTFGQGPLTEANGWRDQADVLVRARLAADAVGATGLAQPEGVAVDPHGGEVYLALAGSSGPAGCTDCAEDTGSAAERHAQRTRYGRVLRWREGMGGPDGDAEDAFHWEEFLTGGAAELTENGRFACPKGVGFTADGLLWIATGIPAQDLGGPDPVCQAVGNNALLAADPRTGTVRRFLTAPRGAEVTGVSASADGHTLFVNIQHPGQATAAWGTPSASDPRAVSNWPDHEPEGRPRSATVAVHVPDGPGAGPHEGAVGAG
ncbi:PhoX family protein [Streptomyces sp. NPDC002845]